MDKKVRQGRLDAKISKFFDKMPCIVDMNARREPPTINGDDTIIRVEHEKVAFRCYKVYYFHRIYNDDRVYKCKATFNRLPETVKKWISRRFPVENACRIKWEGEEESSQLTLFGEEE